MAQKINGKLIAAQILRDIKKRALRLKTSGCVPRLVVFLVGDDASSRLYVRNKERTARAVGIEVTVHRLVKTTSKKEIIRVIHEAQKDRETSGLIVQLPLPRPADTVDILAAIDPLVDVDCLTNERMGALMMTKLPMVPPTPGAVFSILEYLKISLAGKQVVIVGAGTLVGKPLAVMMMNALASVTIVNRLTPKIHDICRHADIVVSGVGKKGIITDEMVKDGAILIDAGISFEDGAMYGDIDALSLARKKVLYTPTPGGLGPITVARLLWNVVLCAEKKSHILYA